MNKFLIPRLTSGLNHNQRGKVAELVIDTSKFQNDSKKINETFMDKYDDYIRYNKIDKTVMFNFPKDYKRLSESRRPSLIRRSRKEDEKRAVDRNIVNGFCNWFMWAKAAYKPPTSKAKK